MKREKKTWQVFLLEKMTKKKQQSSSTDNLTRCFMATALNSGTLIYLFATGGFTGFTFGLLFSDNSGSLHCNIYNLYFFTKETILNVAFD